jgi:hypothetical protein
MSAVAFCSAKTRRIQMVNGLLGLEQDDFGHRPIGDPPHCLASLLAGTQTQTSPRCLPRIGMSNTQISELLWLIVAVRALPRQTPELVASKGFLRFRSGAIKRPSVKGPPPCRRAPDCKYAERMHGSSRVSTTAVCASTGSARMTG